LLFLFEICVEVGAIGSILPVFEIRDILRRIRIRGSVQFITDPAPEPAFLSVAFKMPRKKKKFFIDFLLVTYCRCPHLHQSLNSFNLGFLNFLGSGSRSLQIITVIIKNPELVAPKLTNLEKCILHFLCLKRSFLLRFFMQ
jgi:hypothetical protein